MNQKTAVLRTNVSSSVQKKFEALASSEGVKVSALLRLVIEQLTEDVELPDDDTKSSPVERPSKVTVRLPGDVAGHLSSDAQRHGVSASTWAASILMAKFRIAPQPLKSQRRAIGRAFRQLQGMATNTNQMAVIMNRSAFADTSSAPSRLALMDLQRELAELRSDLARFAGGRYEIQSVPEDRDE